MPSLPRTIEITILSAQDLRIDNKPVKKSKRPYAVVSTDPFNRLPTYPDDSGGSYPSWNHRLVLELPPGARFVDLEVRYKAFSGHRAVGAVRVPVSDIFGGYAPVDFLQFLSYRLRDRRGCRNGIIDFSVKVRGPAGTSPAGAVTGFPVKSIEKDYAAEVAIGVPAWSATAYPPPYHHSSSSFA